MPPTPALEAALVRDLNENQARAVVSRSGRLLIVAGAGAGKTAVLTRRVVHLIGGGVPPEFILCVTFTRKAAEEMQERIEALIARHLPRARCPEIRTLHSWGAQMIRRYPEHFGLTRDFSVYDEHDKEDVLRMIARERQHKTWETSRVETLWKDAAIQREYRKRLLDGNAIDFDMIEAYTLRLLTEHPDVRTRWTRHYRHVLVDEYQDTNLAQVAILGGVAPDNLCVVGDPRQSIYRFRGAEVKTIVEHARDAAFEVIELATNYRSVPQVVALANTLVEGDWKPMESGRAHDRDCAQRKARDATLPPVECVHGRDVCDECDPCTCRSPTPVTGHSFRLEPPLVAALLREEHAGGRPWRDMAVLARNWSAVDAVRDQLRNAGIPINYCGDDEDPWTSEDGRALARALLLAHNPADDNMAALLAEWGMVGARRIADLGEVRASAMRQRCPLLYVLGETDTAWGRVIARLTTRGPGAWLAGQHAAAFVDGLEVLDGYTARGLATRVATITALIVELARRELTLEAFVEWWTGRGVAERLTEGKDAVHLLTIHGAKGLEWPVVVVADARDGVFPTGRVKATPEDRSEDLRVLYVGATRARDRLFITCPTLLRDPWTHQVSAARPSPFLERGLGPLTPWVPSTWGGMLPEGWPTLS